MTFYVLFYVSGHAYPYTYFRNFPASALKCISYTFFKKKIRKYKNMLHKYSFDISYIDLQQVQMYYLYMQFIVHDSYTLIKSCSTKYFRTKFTDVLMFYTKPNNSICKCM